MFKDSKQFGKETENEQNNPYFAISVHFRKCTLKESLLVKNSATSDLKLFRNLAYWHILDQDILYIGPSNLRT
jgi:hypothetical protein